MEQTPIQELIQFMAENLYRGNAIIYGKALDLLEKEKEMLAKAFDEGRFNGKHIYTNEPMNGQEYYEKKYSRVDVN